jgi:hypothetical protein
MTPEDAQLIFESCLGLVLSCYMIGLGIGLVLRVIKSAIDR